MVKCYYCNNEIPLGSWVYNTTDIERPFMCEACYESYDTITVSNEEEKKIKKLFSKIRR
jgi:hypothetical protein